MKPFSCGLGRSARVGKGGLRNVRHQGGPKAGRFHVGRRPRLSYYGRIARSHAFINLPGRFRNPPFHGRAWRMSPTKRAWDRMTLPFSILIVVRST